MVLFRDPRDRHPFHMHDMIRGQPAFVEEAISRTVDFDLPARLRSARRIVLTGCGTSFHAAAYGTGVLRIAMPTRSVRAIHAYDLLQGGPLPRGTTVLGVSHSGSTPTTNHALARLRRQGHRVLGVCGLPDTPMERVCDSVLVIGSLHDRSWANTMSYTSQLAAFAALARGEAPELPALRGISELPAAVAKTLRAEAAVRKLARTVAARRRITFLGSGLEEITALEAALKIRETCSLPASAYHPEQFLHGPFLSLDRDDAVVAILTRGDRARARQIVRALVDTQSFTATLGDGAGTDVRVSQVAPALRPIVNIVPLQFLAYYAALERGANPDVMRTDVPRYRSGVELLFT